VSDVWEILVDGSWGNVNSSRKCEKFLRPLSRSGTKSTSGLPHAQKLASGKFMGLWGSDNFNARNTQKGKGGLDQQTWKKEGVF